MAKDKKSFLLYVDLIHTVDKLPDEKAGELFKLILNYVNDLNPTTDDLLLNIAFEPIKQQLKRDLKRYESICERNKINGLKGGRPQNPEEPKKPSGLFGNPEEPKKPDNDIDNDSEIDKEKFNFKKSLISIGIEKQIISDWLKVRSKKGAVNSETAFNAIKREIEKSGLSANECIKIAVEKSWQGFSSEWIKNIPLINPMAKPKMVL